MSMAKHSEHDATSHQRPTGQVIAFRVGLVVLGLIGWFTTQHLIGTRVAPESGVGDGVFDLLAPLHRWMVAHEGAADALLIASSLVIDLLGAFLLIRAIAGPTIRPFMGLVVLFALRQACQALVALPAPEGMIWRYPGFPSLLVTYGVTNDLFFSGHTAIAVLGAIELSRLHDPTGNGRERQGNWRRWMPCLGVLIVCFEAGTVLVLRAHYTMDVFTGAVTALLAAELSSRWAPGVDGWLGRKVEVSRTESRKEESRP